MIFSVLLWNIWHSNQIEGKDRLNRLLQELSRLIDKHQPECIALNEVIQVTQNEAPPVIEHLQKNGYGYIHRAKMGHMGDYWMSGVVLASRHKLSNTQRHIISKNGSAARSGYHNIDKEIVSATVSIPQGSNIQIIVAHPSATIDSVREHVIGMRSLEKLIRSESFAHNTLLLGDMNEWRLLPKSFRSRVKDSMHSKTGTFLNPTWRHNAYSITPLRLNLDYIYWSKTSDFQLEDFAVLSGNASDHRPLLATFKLAS